MGIAGLSGIHFHLCVHHQSSHRQITSNINTQASMNFIEKSFDNETKVTNKLYF